jgi:hypothetical protein
MVTLFGAVQLLDRKPFHHPFHRLHELELALYIECTKTHLVPHRKPSPTCRYLTRVRHSTPEKKMQGRTCPWWCYECVVPTLGLNMNQIREKGTYGNEGLALRTFHPHLERLHQSSGGGQSTGKSRCAE